MKFKPNWSFWVILGLGFYSNGWKGALPALIIMAVIIALNLVVIFFTSEFRNHLIEDKGFTADGKFIKFFCDRGMHTWGEVVEDKPKTVNGSFMQKLYQLKYGERKSLCCNKNQVVSALLESKYWSRLNEKYYGLREDCLK